MSMRQVSEAPSFAMRPSPYVDVRRFDYARLLEKVHCRRLQTYIRVRPSARIAAARGCTDRAAEELVEPLPLALDIGSFLELGLVGLEFGLDLIFAAMRDRSINREREQRGHREDAR